jgi:hypothetical protein
MAPKQTIEPDGNSSDASTTIGLIALVLAVPGTGVALVTLCVLRRQAHMNLEGKSIGV